MGNPFPRACGPRAAQRSAAILASLVEDRVAFCIEAMKGIAAANKQPITPRGAGINTLTTD
jgi:hypothetical protein